MLSLASLATLVATASLASAHNRFVRIAHNGVWQSPGRYIRNVTNPYTEPTHPDWPQGFGFPIYQSNLPESVRCGFDHMAWANATETLQVKAGDTVEWVVVTVSWPPNTWDNPEQIQWENCPGGRGVCKGSKSDLEPSVVVHDGPAMMHLSRVPAGQEVQNYDGSGEWTKFYTLGIEIRQDASHHDGKEPYNHWLPRNDGMPTRFVGTIPKQTPAGDYLVRMDQVWYGYNREPEKSTDAQLFPSCAHIKVVSDTTGDLPKGIKIPEGLQLDQPGMAIRNDMFPPTADFPASYPYPGGPLWDGESLVQDHGPPCDFRCHGA